MGQREEETVSFLPEERFRAAIAKRFAELEAQLSALIPGAEIHHVGSTAVPGSLTKGDLDIQVRLRAAQFEQASFRLRELFSVNEGGFSDVDAVSFEDNGAIPSVGIHLTVIGSPSDVQTEFRDRLLASESLRRQYDDLKRKFEGGSMEAYRTAKAEFVSRVLNKESEA